MPRKVEISPFPTVLESLIFKMEKYFYERDEKSCLLIMGHSLQRALSFGQKHFVTFLKSAKSGKNRHFQYDDFYEIFGA